MSKSRRTLRQALGQRDTYTARFGRYGTKPNHCTGLTEKTVLLKSVTDSLGNVVTDHLWFNLTKGFEALNLEPGDIVQFDARVTSYQKGYDGRKINAWLRKPKQQDYKLERPTKVIKLKSRAMTTSPRVGADCDFVGLDPDERGQGVNARTASHVIKLNIGGINVRRKHYRVRQ